ncbi:MAG: galactose-1-phosphate uridylyltransferase [Candidatus Omnitrophica bacterium]|nr:galactose-1-phosphate uridylyltransferase [Candidatus Omnitrophota bacterium]
MAQLRRDPITGRWIIVDLENPKGPGDFDIEVNQKKGGTCPFCYGSEHMTPPEIDAFRTPGTARNTPGWFTRVVPNKFPALQIEGNLDRLGVGIYDRTNGVGAHEVIIETPHHHKELNDLSPEEVLHVLLAYRNRSIDLKGDKRFKYLMIFKNYGRSAGASLEHPHSQLIALPFVPKRVTEELKGAERYFEYRDRCGYCDMVHQEMEDKERVVCQNEDFIAFAPFVSRFPFECMLLPKEHASDFSQIEERKLLELAKLLKDLLSRLKEALRDPAYNLLLHTSPVENIYDISYHWHMEMMPRLTQVMGFEWGTGFYINPTSPEDAARYLRGDGPKNTSS